MEASLVALGQLMGSYGLKGDCKVRTFSGETKHFAALEGVQVELRKDGKTKLLVVSAAGSYGEYALLRFKGFESPESVRQLAGHEVWAPRTYAAPLQEGEFYIADLVGCELRFQGAVVAQVSHVWTSTRSDVLEVVCPDGKRYQVPFMDPYIGEVHLQERWIELLTDWILA